MGSAKSIRVAPISKADADAVILRHHYSGRLGHCSQVHLGVFYEGRLHGALQFGLSIDKRKTIALVRDTPWNGFIELNRMAFGPVLPRNSESRAISVAMRMLRKTYPWLQWVVSFADGTQCGDGTIYRAAGFALTGIRPNRTIMRLPDGTIISNKTLDNGPDPRRSSAAARAAGARPLPGYQLRYVYFLDPSARSRLTVKEIPYDEIDRLGAAMYLGQRRHSRRAGSKAIVAPADQAGEGGATPTPALHSSLVTRETLGDA